MNPRYKKIYCCTPVAFHANDGYFIRDTGLISRTLQRMGVESKCIMPLPYHDDDQREGIIRTEFANLSSATWWQQLGIDAVVLYSWGAPRYRHIARAIRKAGLKLVIHMDCTSDFTGCFPDGTSRLTRFVCHLRTKLGDIFRSAHLRRADVITMCPTAAADISKKLFYGPWFMEKLFPMPCPVSPECRYDGRKKQPIILCIGRWDDRFQKRPEVLMKTLELFYESGGTAETRIYGTLTEELRRWHQQLPTEVAEKIKLLGYLQNTLLREEYNNAQVILCPSRFEGSHNVSAEALCCGCSVVTANRPIALADLHWYTTKNSGCIAEEDSPKALALALLEELKLWASDRRSPQAIAEAWHPHFHADKVFNKICE